MRRRGEIWAGVFFLLLGIGDTIGALGLPLGTPLDPKPGFFPLLAGIFLSCLSILYLLRALFGESAGKRGLGVAWRPGLLMMGLFAYSLLLDIMGYVIATLLLSAIVLRILETRPWWRLVSISLVASLGSYLLFDRILGVSLPIGLLNGIL